MKNLIIISVIFLTSCSVQKVGSKHKNKIVFAEFQMGDDRYVLDSEYSVIEIDSCEYIKGWVGEPDGGAYLTHKGNCKNRIHNNINLK